MFPSWLSVAYNFPAVDCLDYNFCWLTLPLTSFLHRVKFTGEYNPKTDSITDTMNGTGCSYLASYIKKKLHFFKYISLLLTTLITILGNVEVLRMSPLMAREFSFESGDALPMLLEFIGTHTTLLSKASLLIHLFLSSLLVIFTHPFTTPLEFAHGHQEIVRQILCTLIHPIYGKAQIAISGWCKIRNFGHGEGKDRDFHVHLPNSC